MSGDKPCPICGKPLRPGWRRWQCDTPGCNVDHVLLNRDGSIKEIVTVGLTIMPGKEKNQGKDSHAKR